jgi:hypothetical protein
MNCRSGCTSSILVSLQERVAEWDVQHKIVYFNESVSQLVAPRVHLRCVVRTRVSSANHEPTD